ncbi:MAG: HTTM domain-containing protein [Lacipirellulaceae bacterium]
MSIRSSLVTLRATLRARRPLLTSVGDDPYWSLLFWFDGPWGVTLLCIAAGGAIVMLGLGVFPRFAAAAVYAWHVSYCHAAFPALVGWDDLLRVYSFLLLISPLGGVWSLPAWWRGRNGAPTDPWRLVAPLYGLTLMRFQLVMVYLDTVWSKLDDPYWRGGQMISYFQMSVYARWPSAVWADLPLSSCLLTYGTLAAEVAIPVLLLTRHLRWLGMAVGVGLHLGIAVSSTLSLFSLAIFAVYPVFLNAEGMKSVPVMRKLIVPKS